MALDERQEELVRAYVKDEPLPASEPPDDSHPPTSEVVTSAPGARIVEVPPDYTVRPRRTLHQRIKDMHKAWLALVPLGAAVYGACRPIWNRGWEVYQWVESVNIAMSASSACAMAQKVNADAVERLRQEVADAGAMQGHNWDQQDEINVSVHRQMTRVRAQTPPPALGPKAKALGR